MKTRTPSQLKHTNRPVYMGIRLSIREAKDVLVLCRQRKMSFSLFVSEVLAAIKKDFENQAPSDRQFSFSGSVILPYPKQFSTEEKV